MENNEHVYDDGHRRVYRRECPTAGGAYAEYSCDEVQDSGNIEPLGSVRFQSDTIPNIGVEGWTNEALLAVVIDRLQCFQEGGFPCIENQEAIVSLQSALDSLDRRTQERKLRNVEGQHKE